MLSGSVPFVLYLRLLQGERDPLRDSQVRTLLAFLAVVVVAVAAWLTVTGRYGWADAARHAAFNTVSVVTTTGFATADYGLWGGTAGGAFFRPVFVGGSTRSASGGVEGFPLEGVGGVR